MLSNLSLFIGILIVIILIALYLGTSWYMVIHGYNKVKGSKKRRKKILPMFYGKNSVFKKLKQIDNDNWREKITR